MKAVFLPVVCAFFLLVFSFCGKKYRNTVMIDHQEWKAKNLDVTFYRNGDPIPHVKDSAEWSQLKSGAWCYYDNNPENGKIYGILDGNTGPNKGGICHRPGA